MHDLGVGENSLIIQSRVEGIDPQQILTRTVLVEKARIPWDAANAYVKRIGVGASVVLGDVLTVAEDPKDAFEEFKRQYSAM